MKGQRLQARREGGKLVVSLRSETRRRQELTGKANRSQGENLELILLQQAEIMRILGIE